MLVEINLKVYRTPEELAEMHELRRLAGLSPRSDEEVLRYSLHSGELADRETWRLLAEHQRGAVSDREVWQAMRGGEAA